PGLIEGAHEGHGLGIRFLKHVERSRLLVHLVDAASLDAADPDADAEKTVATIEHELASFQPELAARERVLVATKDDAASPAQVAAVAAAAARRGLVLDEILFVPAFQPPHKPSGPFAPSHHRFAMLALAFEAYPAFRLSDFEIARGGTTYTIETLRHLRASRGDAEFLLVLGSDSLAGITAWRSWQELLD